MNFEQWWSIRTGHDQQFKEFAEYCYNAGFVGGYEKGMTDGYFSEYNKRVAEKGREHNGDSQN